MKTKIRFGKKYTFGTDMIKIIISEGFKHIPGKGFACKHCKHKFSVRKFLKGKATLYACSKCGARWGSTIK